MPAGSIKKPTGFFRQALIVAITALAFLAGWFGMDYVLTRPVKHQSKAAGFELTYPGKWKKVNSAGIDPQAMGLGALMTTELMVGNGSGENPNNFMGVWSFPTLSTSWETVSADWKEGFTGGMSRTRPGVTMTSPTWADINVTGKAGVSTKMSMSYMGVTYDMEVILFGTGKSYVIMMFMGRNPGGSPDKFQDVIKSVKFQ